MSTATLETRADENQWIWNSFQYHSRTFSLAARFLPRPVQMPIATLYLYCRRVDSIADQRVLEVGADRALDEVARMQERLDATLDGQPPSDEVLWRRLGEVHEHYSLHRGPLEELLEGAMWDLKDRSIQSKADLINYSNLVGGSVGAMMLPFLCKKAHFDDLESAARQLGIAMQITNIVRDVGEDIEQLNRVYLPAAWLKTYGVSREALADGRRVSGYGALVEQTMSVAETHYQKSDEGIASLPFRTRVGIRAAARMYREILNEVRANQYDNLDRRAYVSLGRKLLVAVYDNYDARKARLRS